MTQRRIETLQPLRHPDFGSYHPDDVGWLVRDVTTELREAERAGPVPLGPSNRATLVHEDVPPQERTDFFRRHARLLARRTAEAVGVVAELAYRNRGDALVLASIIRAGVPIGVLLRRWLLWRYDLDVPHYAISVVPGDGIDPVALSWLAEHHDAPGVQFIDGWTGRGSITLEVAASVDAHNRKEQSGFDPEVAVLVDFGECASLFGTREDFLVALASVDVITVGCTSRTILNPEWVKTEAGQHFHGAADWRHEFGPFDQSRWYVDLVAAEFTKAQDAVDERVRDRLTSPAPQVTFAGRPEAVRAGAKYGVRDLEFVRPGVGETTRLLIRDPDPLLVVRDLDSPAVAPVLELAATRGIVPQVDPGLGFESVGLARAGRR